MSTTSDLAREPGYFTRYKNFALGRSAGGALTLRFHAGGGPPVPGSPAPASAPSPIPQSLPPRQHLH